MSVLKIITMIISGYLFGFLMQKGQVFAPQNIIDQFTLDKFIMLKMFLSAAASSIIIQSLMSMYDETFFDKTRTENKVSMWRIVLGGCILGAGMFIGGSCPGNIYVQIGNNVQNVLFIIIGSLSGSLIFFIFDELLQVPN
jgi:uncharacterized membrane protein YedE/YeeE